MAHRVLSWDWRQQPDLTDLAEAIRELSDGKVRMRIVDTDSDQYAIVLADHNVTPVQARDLWMESWS